MRPIGDLSVFEVGLGCMPLSSHHLLEERPRTVATVHAALDSGVTLLDTADIYAPHGGHMGHNEQLVAEALDSYTGTPAGPLMVLTKGGITRKPTPSGDHWGRAGSPDRLLAAARSSQTNLGGRVIDLYLLHRLDPRIRFADQIAGLAAVRDEGIALRLGLSNVRLPFLDRALDLLGGPEDGGIVAVENELSPRYRRDLDVLDRCRERGIAFLPWSPLGGTHDAGDVGTRYAAFGKVAAVHGATAQQVALAWLLALAPNVIVIPGSTRPATIRSSVAAASLTLTELEVELLSATEPLDESVFPDHTPEPPL